MNLSLSHSAVREQRVAYAAAVADQEHALVREIRAIRGQSTAAQVRRIAERSGLPVRWLAEAPSVNGEQGMDKLMEERNVLLLRDRKSPFIEQFQHPLGRCAKFYKLTAYNNCNFWCEYCYLYLTFRNSPVSTHFINYDRMFQEIVTFGKEKKPDCLRVLNLGELGDPLAVDAITGFAEQIIPFMPAHAPNTRLLFLTKSDSVDTVAGLHHGGQTIVSFSINTNKVWSYLEHRTPSPLARLKAARKVAENGYEVRLRIDPIIRYSTWREDYVALVEELFSCVRPTRITLGEYRPAGGLSNHIRSRFPSSPLMAVNGTLTAEAGKLRYPRVYRVQMFKAIADAIRRHDPGTEIALCKESPEVWNATGLGGNGLRCNCLG